MPKNYETVSTFVKVMQRKLWTLFFMTPCRVDLRRQFPLF